jgi:transcriptional regulator with XRE-family HTH domain
LTPVTEKDLRECLRQITLSGMATEAPPIPFQIRLLELLEGLGPHATQSWLADRSGIDRSLISRLARGEREPTIETLQCLAPVLGVEVDALVAGTDAQARLENGGDSVRRSHLEGAVSKMMAYESTIADLEARCRTLGETVAQEQASRKSAEQAARSATAAAEHAATNLRELHARFDAQGKELARSRDMLAQAVADLSALKKQGMELERELQQTQKSSKATALLAALSAATGMATLTHFIGTEAVAAKAREGARGKKGNGK